MVQKLCYFGTNSTLLYKNDTTFGDLPCDLIYLFSNSVNVSCLWIYKCYLSLRNEFSENNLYYIQYIIIPFF